MGKMDAEASINHFSHPHPMQLISFQSSSTTNKLTCSSCTKPPSGLTYICEACDYCLHKPCSNMPRTLTHRADKAHPLTLLHAPAYPGGIFKCNACGVIGSGFCYHCAECQLDLHPVCAFMRDTVKCSAHDHDLGLCFEAPYENKAFVCDVCGGSGSNHWLYRCDLCGFDAHLKCSKNPKMRQPRMDQREQSQMIIKSKSANWGLIDQNFSSDLLGPQPLDRSLHCNNTAPVMFPMRNDGVQSVIHSVVEGLIEGAASQIGQALIQGAMGN